MNNPLHPKFECFPDELTQQILARLPIKSLFRTKCVCKHWYKLTSTSCFKQLYNKISVKTTAVLIQLTESPPESSSSLVYVDNFRAVSEFSLDFIKDRVKIRASCYGLLCCSSIREKGVYYVCNPVTREFKLLPVSGFSLDNKNTLVGLACDLSTQKYNVVLAGYQRLFENRQDKTFVCFVYDSESKQWRKFVSLQDDHLTHMNKNQAVFINGVLHWLMESCSSVLVLDLNSDTWRKIYLPNEMTLTNGYRLYLLDSDGCLSVTQISETWMNIWMMKDYDRQHWHMVDRISLRCIRGMNLGVFPISQTGQYVFLATSRQVLVYQRNTREWKEMYSVKNSSTLPLWSSAHAFQTTIFSCC